jgi:hypothetical protein
MPSISISSLPISIATVGEALIADKTFLKGRSDDYPQCAAP